MTTRRGNVDPGVEGTLLACTDCSYGRTVTLRESSYIPLRSTIEIELLHTALTALIDDQRESVLAVSAQEILADMLGALETGS